MRKTPSQKKRYPKEQHAVEVFAPKDGWFQVMKTAVKPPEHPQFHEYNQEDVVVRFAREHGKQFKNITPLFQQKHNSSPEKTVEALNIISIMALKNLDTLYYFEGTANNLEAASYIGFIAQHSIIGRYITNTFCLCHMWLGNETFAAWSRLSENDLRTSMASMLEDWECPICLEGVSSVDGVRMMWTCAHGVCNVCEHKHFNEFVKNKTPCPICRANIMPIVPIKSTTRLASV